MTGNMLEKRCSKCGDVKSVDEFNKNKSKLDGLAGWCKTCSAEYSRQYHIDHQEERNEYNRQYHKKHKEERAEYNKQWATTHREELLEYHRQYYIDHQEEQQEYMRQRRKDNPEYARQYCIDHPEVVREENRRRRSRKAELPFDFYAEDELFALECWDYKCAICGKELGTNTKNNTVWAFDHWIAIADTREDNPGTVPENMLPLCHGRDSCNSSKCSSDPIEWLYRKYSSEQADEILFEINKYFKFVKDYLTTEETE